MHQGNSQHMRNRKKIVENKCVERKEGDDAGRGRGGICTRILPYLMIRQAELYEIFTGANETFAP